MADMTFSRASDSLVCADPILAYTAEAEINNLQWSSAHPDWVAIAFENKVQMLRV